MSSCPASRCTSELYRLSLSSLSFRPSSRPWRVTGAAADVPERILLFLRRSRALEVELGRRGVPQVPDIAIHALLPRSARIDGHRVAAAVGDGQDHPSAARALAAPRLPLARRGGTGVEG